MTESESTDALAGVYAHAFNTSTAEPIIRVSRFPVVVHESTGRRLRTKREYQREQDLLVNAFGMQSSTTPLTALNDVSAGHGIIWLELVHTGVHHGKPICLLSTFRLRLEDGEIAEVWPSIAQIAPEQEMSTSEVHSRPPPAVR